MTDQRFYNGLFPCTGNSAPSIGANAKTMIVSLSATWVSVRAIRLDSLLRNS